MRLTLQSVFKFCTFLDAYVNYFSSRSITHCIIILLESKSTEEKKKSSAREWQGPLTALAHAIARARIHPPCLYTGAFGCVVVALALLCAYTIICCHRYIYTRRPRRSAVRIYAANERAIFQRVRTMNGRLVVLVLFRRFSLSRGWFCGRLAPSQVHDSRRKIKKIHEFLDGRMFRNYDILLGPERFILRTKTVETFFLYFQVSIYLFTSFPNLLYQDIALGYFALFLYLAKIHVLFVQYKKC